MVVHAVCIQRPFVSGGGPETFRGPDWLARCHWPLQLVHHADPHAADQGGESGTGHDAANQHGCD